MNRFSTAEILALPVPERLQLVQDIWDSIADVPDGLELTEEEKRLIDERLEACRANPAVSSPWKEALARVAAR